MRGTGRSDERSRREVSVNSRESAGPRPVSLSPDRDIDLRRRFEALKGHSSLSSSADPPVDPGSLVKKQPLTLAEIQGSIGKRHSTDLANAQRNWIENWTARPSLEEPSEEEAQKQWINQIQFAKIADRGNRRDELHRRAEPLSSERRSSSLISSKSSPASSPRKVSRNVVVKSTTLTPSAPTFGYCDVPRISVNALPVTATSVKDDVKKCKEIVTDCGKTIKVLKLEEPPKYEKKVKGRSPRKMKAVIDEGPSANQGRWKKCSQSSKSSRRNSDGAEKSNKYDGNDLQTCTGTLSPETVAKYRWTCNGNSTSARNGFERSRHCDRSQEHYSPKKLKRSASLPGGLNSEQSNNQSTLKYVKNYDVNETRNFIKQKQKEREERLAAEKRKKTIEAEERAKKMQHLRDTQRKIMQKIKKRTVNKFKSTSVISKESEQLDWVGPLESATPSILDSSLEFAKPKPKSQLLSCAAMGTITFKDRKKPTTPTSVNVEAMRSVQADAALQGPNASSIVSSQYVEVACETSPQKITCYRHLDVSDNLSHQSETSADCGQLVESSTQVEVGFDKCLCSKSKSRGVSSTHSPSKRPKHSLSREYWINKENMDSSNSLRDPPFPSALDKFLADYMPTPQKARRLDIKRDAPSWLEEINRTPDKFNLMNTLDMALRKPKSMISVKERIADIGTESSANAVSRPLKSNDTELLIDSNPRVTQVNDHLRSSSSSVVSDELFLEPPAARLDDVQLSSSPATFNTTHSFEPFSNNYPTPNVPPTSDKSAMEDTNPLLLPLKLDNLLPHRDVGSSNIGFLFSPSKAKILQGNVDNCYSSDTDGQKLIEPRGEFRILGEKIIPPKGEITVRKPLKRRTLKVSKNSTSGDQTPKWKSLYKLPSDSVQLNRGSEDCDFVTSAISSDFIQSRSTSFASMKEGSCIFSPHDTKADRGSVFGESFDPKYLNFVKNVQQTGHNVQSEQSSDSLSEIVKVSRTVSRGSTVISEEVSEVQNTVSFSKNAFKFNSSSIHNKIRSEIEQLDRVNESLSSFLDANKTVGHLQLSAPSFNHSESSVDQISQDAVTVRLKTPPSAPVGNMDTSISVVPRSTAHSREPSCSSMDASLAALSGIDVGRATVDMFDNLIKDEKLRTDQHLSSLKTRMRSVCNRTKRDLEFIEVQRKRLIESGHEEEARELKRKQRGHIMKLNEEIEELHRLRSMENKACQERCLLLKQQEQLIKLLLQQENKGLNLRSSRGSMKSLHSNQLDDTVQYFGNDRNSDIIDRKKREYREKEETLKERKKNIEGIVAWKKRLEAEEKNVREMEKMIAQTNFSTFLPQSGVERSTSPCIEANDNTPEELKEISELPQAPISATSQSESEHHNKDYYSDSFEHSSAMSEMNATTPLAQGSLLNKAMKMPILKVPLSPRVTIIKRRHSSGSDESMLLSQNETLSEQSDVEVRVSALEQQLKHRKSELAKLKREYQKNQKERLRTTEKNLIYQIQLYDSFIEQVKNEIKEFESTDIKVTKPQIKQPRFHDRRQSDKFVGKCKSKEVSESVSECKNTACALLLDDSSAQDSSVAYQDKESAHKLGATLKDNISESLNEVTEKLEVQSDPQEQDEIASDTLENDVKSIVDTSNVMTDPAIKDAMEKVKLKAMEPSKDLESSISDKDFSIEEIIEKAEQSKMLDSSDEIQMENSIVTNASVTEIISESNKLSVVDEAEESLSCVSTHPEFHFRDVVSKDRSLESCEELSREDEGNFELKVLHGIAESVMEQISSHSHVTNKRGSESELQTESITRPSSIPSLNNVSERRATFKSLTLGDQVLEARSLPNKVFPCSSSPPFGINVDNPSPLTFELPETDSNTPSEKCMVVTQHQSGRGVQRSVPENPSGSCKSVSEGITTTKPLSSTASLVVSPVERNSQMKSVSEKSGARKRLDMTSDSPVVTTSVESEILGYEPTMQIEGGKRSISDLIGSNDGESDKYSAEVTSGSERISEASATRMTDSLPPSNLKSSSGEALEDVEEEGEEQFESVSVDDNCSGKDESVLNKFDFHVEYFPIEEQTHKDTENVPIKDHQTEAGDNYAIQPQVVSGDKKELGQGDELYKDLEVQSIEADSLDDSFVDDFNATFDVGELKQYLESSLSQDADLSPSKVANNLTVMQLLQNSFEMSHKLWEDNLVGIKKSSEETPLLAALQRERQQNFNVDSISQMIYDSYVDDATCTALLAYSKKKHLANLEIETAIAKDMDTEFLKVGDNEKFWLGKQAAHEAERLRRHQLQIEREIEQLEQAQEVVPYYYVREIPNKPPPPYTPPKPALPSKEETVSRVLQGGEILWDIEMSGGDPSKATMPSTFQNQIKDDSYRMFLFELAQELYLKLKPRPPAKTPPWVITQRPGKPRPPIKCKEDLLKHLEKEIKLAFGFEPRILRESLITKWTRKRRDHVNEIIVRELQESQAEWRDFTVEENMIKNQVADDLIAEAIDEAVTGLSFAFTRKFDTAPVE